MPGTVLLLAASPVGRGRLVDAAAVLPVLAAVAPAVLSGADTANVVELADPLEPQAVLTRLRAAAAAPGPLTVYLTGQLHLDRRQHRPHLALARTTAATVRYTALPWHWIREELRLRSAADTALVVDLHADAEAWKHITERGLDCGPYTAVYGRVAPPARRGPAEPAYMKTVATLLRSGHRPPLGTLHEQALSRIPEETRGNLLLAHAGGRTTGGPTPPTPAGPAVPLGAVPLGAVPTGGMPTGTAPGVSAPGLSASWGPAVDRPGDGLGDRSGDRPGDGLGDRSGDRPGNQLGDSYGDRTGDRPGGPLTDRLDDRPGGRLDERLTNRPGDRPGDRLGDPSGEPDGRRPADPDPHAAISAAVRGGLHREADGLAARYEEGAVRTYGAGSEQALHWREVRADLAMFAGDPVRSCRAWLAVAEARLAAGQAADAPPVEAAVDRAHHQWGRIEDPAHARELGTALARLRLRVPGRRRGALEDIQRQLGRLQAAP
ncbi:hypothetical protein ACFY2V_13195 [Streptomyces eurythermus]|uniref:hypothetical protein n=1 Tax=Streptomyces eurythermus TaxID=42237 RepID=UPI003677BAD7